MDDIIAIKRNLEGKETWRYGGKILEKTEDRVIFEAFFNRDDLPFHEIVLKRGDRFVETWYRERWYNIFEIHDRDDDHLKAYYCNVGKPVDFWNGIVSYIDLALDLLVYPDGRQFVLDEDEFDEMPLDEKTRQQALDALQELKEIFN